MKRSLCLLVFLFLLSSCNGFEDLDSIAFQNTSTATTSNTGDTSTSSTSGTSNTTETSNTGEPCVERPWFIDSDGDGQGINDVAFNVTSCTPPTDYVSNPNDCNDTNPAIFAGAPELCDGLDNNCNNDIDENLGLGEACSLGQGACLSQGVTVCNDARDGTVCGAEIIEPADAEDCSNDIDDTCDGNINEGCACLPDDPPVLCGSDVGICTKGLQKCKENGTLGECLNASETPVTRPGDLTEVCNGLDDDCNGTEDDGGASLCTLRSGTEATCSGTVGCTYTCIPGFVDANELSSDGCECQLDEEDNEVSCTDAKDNDCDGLIDCQDSDCQDDAECINTEICNDTVDNDGDGFTDCLDSDCERAPNCTETTCNNDVDDDDDGLTDCADSDCANLPVCQPESRCDDGVDNDGDGQADCQDPDCTESEDCNEFICDDEIDNDSDGLIDCLDPSCATSEVCTSCNFSRASTTVHPLVTNSDVRLFAPSIAQHPSNTRAVIAWRRTQEAGDITQDTLSSVEWVLADLFNGVITRDDLTNPQSIANGIISLKTAATASSLWVATLSTTNSAINMIQINADGNIGQNYTVSISGQRGGFPSFAITPLGEDAVALAFTEKTNGSTSSPAYDIKLCLVGPNEPCNNNDRLLIESVSGRVEHVDVSIRRVLETSYQATVAWTRTEATSRVIEWETASVGIIDIIINPFGGDPNVISSEVTPDSYPILLERMTSLETEIVFAGSANVYTQPALEDGAQRAQPLLESGNNAPVRPNSLAVVSDSDTHPLFWGFFTIGTTTPYALAGFRGPYGTDTTPPFYLTDLTQENLSTFGPRPIDATRRETRLYVVHASNERQIKVFSMSDSTPECPQTK